MRLQVRIYVADPTVSMNSIDAVALESRSDHFLCESCDARSFVVARHPPFSSDVTMNTRESVFTDE